MNVRGLASAAQFGLPIHDREDVGLAEYDVLIDGNPDSGAPVLAVETSSPISTPISPRLPLSSSLPGPMAMIVPRCGFSFAVSGRMIPPEVVSVASLGWISTRSSVGRNLIFFFVGVGVAVAVAGA